MNVQNITQILHVHTYVICCIQIKKQMLPVPAAPFQSLSPLQVTTVLSSGIMDSFCLLLDFI